MNKEFVLLP